MKQTIIFDMDGLLIDSERFWVQQDVMFLERHGIPLDTQLLEDMQVLLSGNSVLNGTKIIKEKFNLSASVEELYAERLALTEEIYTRLAIPLPGAQTLLDALRNAGIPMAIGSGSSLERIEQIVDRFQWREYFGTLASSDHVEYRGKPAPDIFLYAAEHMGADPETCVVLEDSVNGIIAAHAAQMQSIAVPPKQVHRQLYEAADLVADSLQSPEVYTFLNLTQQL